MKPEENAGRLKHLYNRAGFGLPINVHLSDSSADHVSNLFSTSKNSVDLKALSSDQVTLEEMKTMTDEERKSARKVKNEELRDLNHHWLKTMAQTQAVLREKMAFFWHGHFACRSGNPVFMQRHLNTIRRNGMGKFSDLLLAVSKDAAMLQFLNNQQNRKAHPNENFARELMELFTLGRGHYTENDVKEAARAFTGWGFNEDGEYIFRERQHDFGEKEFLSKRGNWNGEDILNIILEQKQCAAYICEKIYLFFVNEKPDLGRIRQLADQFYQSGYDIQQLMQSIFTADWFYDAKNQGAKIKSPIELIVPLMRDFDLEFANENVAFNIQRILGQVLLFPPNVAGWPGGKNWIDSSSLTYRMKLPRVLLAEEVSDVNPKDDGDVNGFSKMEQKLRKGERLRTQVNWNNFIAKYTEMDDSKLFSAISAQLLNVPDLHPSEELAKSYSSRSSKEDMIRGFALHVMTLPEYQLC